MHDNQKILNEYNKKRDFIIWLYLKSKIFSKQDIKVGSPQECYNILETQTNYNYTNNLVLISSLIANKKD